MLAFSFSQLHCASLLLRGKRHRIFREIYAALVAFSAVPLRRFARRTIEEQSEMASLAEAFRLAIRGLALRALHDLMVTRGIESRPPPQLRVLREAPVRMDGTNIV
jgi:hypothetical protein